MSVSNSILKMRDAIRNPLWRFQLDMRPLHAKMLDAAARLAAVCHLSRPGALLALSSILLGGIHVVMMSCRSWHPFRRRPLFRDASDQPLAQKRSHGGSSADASPGVDARQPSSKYGISPNTQAISTANNLAWELDPVAGLVDQQLSPVYGIPRDIHAASTDDEIAYGLEVERVEVASPPRYEPFIAAPALVKVSKGRLSPDSPHALLPEGSCWSRNLERPSSQTQLSSSSAAAAARKEAQPLPQQWLQCARSPDGYVPFGSVPPPAAAISHDDLCAALVDAVSAVREETNAEKEAAIAAVRWQAKHELREAIAHAIAEAEASVEAAVASARAEWEYERSAAVEQARAAATTEAEARMEAAMVRVHMLMLASVILGAAVNGVVELFGMATKGTTTASAARVGLLRWAVKRR
jgi:hypothetical protein